MCYTSFSRMRNHPKTYETAPQSPRTAAALVLLAVKNILEYSPNALNLT